MLQFVRAQDDCRVELVKESDKDLNACEDVGGNLKSASV
jgi:hypothetical protein